MIRLGSQIRLTCRGGERFRKITDIEPVGNRTLDDLDACIARCKARYMGVSEETRFRHWLIDREYAQYRLAASRGRSSRACGSPAPVAAGWWLSDKRRRNHWKRRGSMAAARMNAR